MQLALLGVVIKIAGDHERTGLRQLHEQHLMPLRVARRRLQHHRAVAYRGLTPDDVQLFEMVTLHGFKVSELAAGRGCARETLARKLSRIRAIIAANRAAAQNPETVQ